MRHDLTIRAVRSYLDIPQESLAEHLNVCRQTIARWEYPPNHKKHTKPPELVMMYLDGILRMIAAGIPPKAIVYHIMGGYEGVDDK